MFKTVWFMISNINSNKTMNISAHREAEDIDQEIGIIDNDISK